MVCFIQIQRLYLLKNLKASNLLKYNLKAQPTELTEPEVRDNMWTLTVMDASVEVSGVWSSEGVIKMINVRLTVALVAVCNAV